MALVKLKDASLWALDSGLVASGDSISLTRVEDDFDDYTLAPLFGKLEHNNGEVSEAGNVLINSPAGTDAAQMYLTPAINEAVARKHVYHMRLRDRSLSGYPFSYEQSDPVSLNNTPILSMFLHFTGVLRLRYRDAGDTERTWDPAAAGGAGAWTVATTDIGAVDETLLYEFTFENDGTQWRMILKDLNSDTVLVTTDWITWANTKDDSLSGWLKSGDPFTGSGGIDMTVMSYHEGYPAGPITATMGAVATGGILIEQLPITETVTSGAAIVWRYDIGAGWVTPGGGTLAELIAALVGTRPSTLNLEATLTSDTDAAALFDIDGRVIGCTPPLQATYELPQEVITEEEEFVIFEGCE